MSTPIKKFNGRKFKMAANYSSCLRISVINRWHGCPTFPFFHILKKGGDSDGKICIFFLFKWKGVTRVPKCAFPLRFWIFTCIIGQFSIFLLSLKKFNKIPALIPHCSPSGRSPNIFLVNFQLFWRSYTALWHTHQSNYPWYTYTYLTEKAQNTPTYGKFALLFSPL